MGREYKALMSLGSSSIETPGQHFLKHPCYFIFDPAKHTQTNARLRGDALDTDLT